jgi:Superfamily II DNA and RNA helicases
VVYKVPAMQKSRILVKIIEQENPASAIIFCNTKADVHFVSVVLRRFGYDVGEISADLTQAAREEVLEKLRLNKLKFLVATDVAARGIDIHELSHVFQYQPPQDHEAYVHRTGRTGRAGAAGVAISLVSGMEEIELEQIAKKFSIPMVEHSVPADEELETLISQRAVFLLEARLRKADNIQKERMQRFMRTWASLRPMMSPARFWPCWWTNSTRARSMLRWSSPRRNWSTWCGRDPNPGPSPGTGLSPGPRVPPRLPQLLSQLPS